jgi:FkbM family methyltransferase
MIKYLKFLEKQKHPLRFVISYVLFRTGLCRLFRFRHNGFIFQFHASTFSAGLWIDPSQKREDSDFFAAYLKPSDVVVDVGANIGTLSLAASRIVGATGKVYSLEANPRIFQYLQHNLLLNSADNVVTFSAAAGHTSGMIHFSDNLLDDQNAVLQNGAGLMVPVRTLNELFASEMKINLLKIDVEGYEKFVLEGALDILSRVKVVYFEAYTEHFTRFNYQFNDVWRILQDQGLATFRFVAPRHIVSVSSDYQPLQCENLVAIREMKEFKQRTDFSVQ